MAAALKKDHEHDGRELVRILLGAGADPAAQDAQHFRTALHTAAVANDVELVKIILDAGVDANIRNVHNTIPLHVALARGAKLCVGLLLSAGANCNLQDDEGDNAFHIAAEAAKMIRENIEWIFVMLRYPNAAIEVRNHRYEVGDWVKFKRSVKTPTLGWQGARHKSVGFVQNVQDRDNLIVSFCSGEAHVLADEIAAPLVLSSSYHAFGCVWLTGMDGVVNHVIALELFFVCDDDSGILRVGFPGASRGWKADPAEMERVEEFKVGDWVESPLSDNCKTWVGSCNSWEHWDCILYQTRQ
ncbi:hypothetical protein IFM89_011121 [Coptis chinensis]|uniref:RING-type E3 ubiquitin transferase n=1 Tax=Coptis chinensis TaxID=261450 RepID=A0A835LQ00_9MAGN|nr:hypothetical protein IFM89_011121 [Coptis chinensis]